MLTNTVCPGWRAFPEENIYIQSSPSYEWEMHCRLPFWSGEDIPLPMAQLCNLPQVICKWNEEVQPKKPVLSSASTIVLQSHWSILEFNSSSFLTFGRLPADFNPMQHLLLWFLWHFLLVPSLKWLVLSFYDYPPFFPLCLSLKYRNYTKFHFGLFNSSLLWAQPTWAHPFSRTNIIIRMLGIFQSPVSDYEERRTNVKYYGNTAKLITLYWSLLTWKMLFLDDLMFHP